MSATATAPASNATPTRPPGPRGLPWLGTSFMASRDSTKKLSNWAREYGDIVYYHFLDFHCYVLFHPQHIEQVLLGKTGNFIKGMTSRANPELFGNDLREHMRVIEPALEAIMISSTGFNSIAFFLRIPTPTRKLHFLAVQKLNDIVYGLIASGREKLKGTEATAPNANGARDLLTLLLTARDDDGNSMSDQQLRDEVITLLLAGHETTALNLSWTWYLLAQHPEVEQKLYAELDAVLGTRPPT